MQNAVLEESYIEPVNLKLQKHFQFFEVIVQSFPINYFNRADAFDLEQLCFLNDAIGVELEVMKLNKAGYRTGNKDSSRYYLNAVNNYAKILKIVTSMKNSLRISPTTRMSPNRSQLGGPSDVGSHIPRDANRDAIVNESPFDSGTPEQ